MEYLNYLLSPFKQDLEDYPPFIVKGHGPVAAFRRFYLTYSESYTGCIVLAIFINYIFFCGYNPF
jgi:hypothetical protein